MRDSTGGDAMVVTRKLNSASSRRGRVLQRRAQTQDAIGYAEYRVRAKVWLYQGKGGWHFANLSPQQSAEIRARFSMDARGWGSLPVSARIGKTEWRTAIFPARRSSIYM